MSAMTTLRVAVAGCGMISEFHLRGWSRLANVEVVALCDVDQGAAHKRAQAFAPEARVHARLEDMLREERVDIVDVATPPSTHVEHCMTAITHGCHVICQKPLADSSAAALHLAALAQAAGVALAVHDNHRMRPWFGQILSHHRAHKFGRILRARLAQWDAAAPAEAFKRTAPRGVMFEYGTHLLDMMLALFGAPDAVTARTGRPNAAVAGESYCHAIFDYGTFAADIDVAWKPAGPATGAFHLLGERGEALYEGSMTRGPSSRFRLVVDGELLTDEARDPLTDYVESFYQYQRAFVAMLTLGTAASPKPVSAAESATVLRWMELAYASAQSGRAVAAATDESQPLRDGAG